MPQIVPAHQPVVNLAKASAPTAVPNPRCEVPDCTWHPVFRVTLDNHISALLPFPYPCRRAVRRTWPLCLCHYAAMLRAQALGWLEIVAVEAL